MASELFLGPDGGPYVSVNENSGDIELKDNSGNVVMKWDESNTQWDVSSNNIQNVGSLGVEQIDNTSTTEANSTTVIKSFINDRGAAIATQPNTTVSTSAEVIYEGPNTFNISRALHLILVAGDEDGGDAFFGEILLLGDWTAPEVIGPSVDNNNPASRSYSRSGGELELAMSSGTYNITISSLAGGVVP